jgi:hypothetical protein
MAGRETATKRVWYEKYIPFVARSPEMQIRWLEAAFRKGTLTHQDITPYINLLMAPDGEEHLDLLRDLFRDLDPVLLENMLAAADIYDAPGLFRLISQPLPAHALLVITKRPPLYEKSPQQVMDRAFQAVFDRSEELLAEAAARAQAQGAGGPHFQEAYERFKEIKEDEKLLSALYPKAVI